MAYAAHALTIIVPFVALAVVGILLLWRHHDFITAFIALGFASVALCHITSTLVGFYIFDGPVDFAAQAHRFGWTLPATHWGTVVGLWTGCLGLLVHTLLSLRRYT